MNTKYESIDAYHASVSEDVRPLLETLRQIIHEAAPDAKEVISYNMPAFQQNKVLVYYAAAKTHIGFYPCPSPILFFKNELEDYKTSKGAIQFPIENGIPAELVKKIVRFRVEEDAEKAKLKKAKSS